jgi:hypothetical protein
LEENGGILVLGLQARGRSNAEKEKKGDLPKSRERDGLPPFVQTIIINGEPISIRAALLGIVDIKGLK